MRQVAFWAEQPLVKLNPFAAVVVALPPKWKAAVVVVFPFKRVSPERVVEASVAETVPVKAPTDAVVMVPSVARSTCIVDEPETTSDVRVGGRRGGGGRVGREEVGGVKVWAGLSRWTWSLDRGVVAVAPIKT